MCFRSPRPLHRRNDAKVKLKLITDKHADVLARQSNPTVPYALRSGDELGNMIKQLGELRGELRAARSQAAAAFTVSIKDAHGRIKFSTYDIIVGLLTRATQTPQRSFGLASGMRACTRGAARALSTTWKRTTWWRGRHRPS